MSRPFARLEWRIAWRYLRARRKEGFISVISIFSFTGIMLGVATLITVMAVMNGFRAQLLERIVAVNGHLEIQSRAGSIPEYDDVVTSLLAVDGVKAAVPQVIGAAMASSPGAARGALVRGIRASDLRHLVLVSENIRSGSIDNFEGSGALVIGSRLARSLGVGVGDSITLLAPRGSATAFGTAPRVRQYPVSAIFQIGMSEIDGSYIYMPLADAQDFFNLQAGEVSLIDIRIVTPDDAVELRTPLSVAVGPGYAVTDWIRANATLSNALKVERNVMFMILTLIVLVAAFNIISGLTMLVKDKGHDIAVMRSMGATRGAIMRVFFLAGSLIGASGTIAGTIAGIALCENIEEVRQWISRIGDINLFPPEIYFLSQLPAKIESVEVVWVTGMALGLSLAATLYPSWKAARLDPVEALRHE